MEILKEFILTKKSMVLIPGDHANYLTTVLEGRQRIHVDRSMENIINDSCIALNSTTFAGRREAMRLKRPNTQKLPIPVCIINKMVFFPTHGLRNDRTYWFSLLHIARIKRTTNRKETCVMFVNGETITISCSFESFQRLMLRAIDSLPSIGINVNDIILPKY